MNKKKMKRKWKMNYFLILVIAFIALILANRIISFKIKTQQKRLKKTTTHEQINDWVFEDVMAPLPKVVDSFMYEGDKYYVTEGQPRIKSK